MALNYRVGSSASMRKYGVSASAEKWIQEAFDGFDINKIGNLSENQVAEYGRLSEQLKHQAGLAKIALKNGQNIARYKAEIESIRKQLLDLFLSTKEGIDRDMKATIERVHAHDGHIKLLDVSTKNGVRTIGTKSENAIALENARFENELDAIASQFDGAKQVMGARHRDRKSGILEATQRSVAQIGQQRARMAWLTGKSNAPNASGGSAMQRLFG